MDVAGVTLEMLALRLHDKVLIRNCPPISARKRFRLEKIISSPETARELAHAESVTQS